MKVRRSLCLLISITAAISLAGCGSEPEAPAGATSRAQTQTQTPTPTTTVAVQAKDNRGQPVDPEALEVIRQVAAAVAARDSAALLKLCDSCADAKYRAEVAKELEAPGTLEELAAVLATHGAPTDGYTYPGFILAGFGSQSDFDDAQSLGVETPEAGYGPAPENYKGLTTAFEDGFANGTGEFRWNGFSRRT